VTAAIRWWRVTSGYGLVVTVRPSTQRSRDDDALLFIEAAHGQLAAFATTSYAADGRGVIHVVIQALVPGTLAVIDTAMIYLTLHHLHQLVASQSASGRAGRDALIAVAERYDPHHEALVSVAIGRRRPVTIVMELDHPVVPIQVSGVH
jgi:hypothetical protein